MGWMFEEWGKPAPNRVMIKARTADNPHLPPGYIESLNLSDARLPISRSSSSLWCGLLDLRSARVGCGCRPDSSRPTWGLSTSEGVRPCHQDVEGLEVIVEEVCVSDTLEQVHASQCAELLQSYGLTMLDCFSDPAGRARNAQTGLNSIAIYESTFREAGVLSGDMRYSLNPIERHIPNGVEATRARFQDHTGARNLFVSRALTETARTSRYPSGVLGVHGSLLSYRYPEKGGSNMPRKTGEDDHFCDALRYYVIGRHGVMDSRTSRR